VFAAEDALALSAEIAAARASPALDPRLEPFLDRAHLHLRGVRHEVELNAALADFRPILDALSRWPGPREPGTSPGPPPERSLSWSDARVLRFGAAFSALWALAHGPDDEGARQVAQTSVEFGRRAGLLAPDTPVVFTGRGRRTWR